MSENNNKKFPNRNNGGEAGSNGSNDPNDPAHFVPTENGESKEDEEQDQDMATEMFASGNRLEKIRHTIEKQNLPVKNKAEELKQQLEKTWLEANKNFFLLQGETGSGKSVYGPIAINELLKSKGLNPRVRVMQPRRDAASNITTAIAAVTGEDRIGDRVGFATSEFKAVRSDTEIGISTPGIFLRHLINNELTKEEIGALVIDEIHEGSVEYHLVMGLLKMKAAAGEIPPVLLTSATFNKERIQEFFGMTDDEYARIEGRTHPVDVEYYYKDDVRPEEKGHYLRDTAGAVVYALHAGGDGDVLVFMPGAKEIRETMNNIQHLPPQMLEGVEIIPLHGNLTPQERQDALSGDKKPGVKRRIIVSTNVAETSITVPGVTWVVDSCRQRSVRYNPKSGIIERGTEYISQDQAEQRTGRAGRIKPGRCIRLLGSKEYEKLAPHPESEIQRTNLSHLVLQLKKLGIDPVSFPFIDPPQPGALEKGTKELQTLGALDAEGKLTEIGQEMTELPFEPRIGRMIVEAKKRQCLEPALVLAAFERETRVLLGPSRQDEEQASGYDEKEKRKSARRKVQGIQNIFDRGGSDWLKALNVFSEAIKHGVFEVKDHSRNPQDRRTADEFYGWCKKSYLHGQALTHIAYKLKDYARYAGVRLDRANLKEKLDKANDEDLGSVILSGHTDMILYNSTGGAYIPTYTFLSNSMTTTNVSPASEAFEGKPKLCVASRIEEGGGTSKRGGEVKRNYAQNVHPIGLKQLREIAPHLIQEQEGSTWYDPATDSVVQEISLLAKNSTIVLGKENRQVKNEAATKIFAAALADGSRVKIPASEHNREILRKLNELKSRTNGLVKPPENMSEWYVSKLGNIASQKEALVIDENLRMNFDEYCSPEMLQQVETAFPAAITVGEKQYPVNYSGANTYGNRDFGARITLSPDDIFQLRQTDFPPLGTQEHPAPMVFSVFLQEYGNNYSNTDLETLKTEIDGLRLQREFNHTELPKAEILMIPDGEPLPEIDPAKYPPKPYAKNYKNEDIFTYPGVRAEYKGQGKYDFLVQYYPFQNKADEQTRSSQSIREDVVTKWKAAEERSRILKATQKIYNDLENEFFRIKEKYKAEGEEDLTVRSWSINEMEGTFERTQENLNTNPEYYIQELQKKWQEFLGKWEWDDKVGKLRSNIDAETKRMHQLLTEKPVFNEPRLFMLSETQQSALREDKNSLDEYLGDVYRYGPEKGQESANYLSTVLQKIKAFNGQVEAIKPVLYEKFANEVRTKLENPEQAKDVRVLTVENGVITRVQTGRGEEVGNNALSFGLKVEYGKVMGKFHEFDLDKDGEYIISGSDTIVRVKRDENGKFIPVRFLEKYNREHYDDNPDTVPFYEEKPRTSGLGVSGFAALAEAFQLKKEGKPDQNGEKSKAAATESKPATPKQEQEVRYVDAEFREQKIRGLQYLRTLHQQLKALGEYKAVKDEILTPAMKERRKLQDVLLTRFREVGPMFREIETALEGTETRVDWVNGKMGELERKLTSQLKKVEGLFAGKYNGDWLDDYKEWWNEVWDEVEQHEDAQIYIRDGTLKADDIVKKVREKLSTHLSKFQTGEKVPSLYDLVDLTVFEML